MPFPISPNDYCVSVGQPVVQSELSSCVSLRSMKASARGTLPSCELAAWGDRPVPSNGEPSNVGLREVSRQLDDAYARCRTIGAVSRLAIAAEQQKAVSSSATSLSASRDTWLFPSHS